MVSVRKYKDEHGIWWRDVSDSRQPNDARGPVRQARPRKTCNECSTVGTLMRAAVEGRACEEGNRHLRVVALRCGWRWEVTSNPRDVIADALTDPEVPDASRRLIAEHEADGALALLAKRGFVVVACPPGGRVVVSRESKVCEACGGGGWATTADARCPVCGGSGVVEATTIHGERPDVSAVFDEVIAYVHTHKRYKALTDDEKMRAALEVLVGDAFASKGWAAVALPEETPQ